MAKNRIFFITFLRALAACIITNSHYTNVYPVEIIANGGLLGDILFFAVSGYCLVNIKTSFVKWYWKRLYRVYPPVLFITLVYVLIGSYYASGFGLIKLFIYPTYYHFIASIVVLYVPYYIVMKIQQLREKLLLIMAVIALVWIIVYIIVYDKSYYHIDDVYDPMIRFLFFESMLLGAYFREIDSNVRNMFKRHYVVGLISAFVLYFSSKSLFAKYDCIVRFQFLNQIMIFILLYYFFRVFASIDNLLEIIPDRAKSVITFISNITLEIYLVQFVIIDKFKNISAFPVNWIVLTISILLASSSLHYLCKLFYFAIQKGHEILIKNNA